MKEYIERDLLIQQAEVIASFRKRFYMNKEYIKDAEFVIDWVKNIPAADVVELVEVVRGEWEPIKEEMYSLLRGRKDIITGYKCSVCGRRERFEEPFCNCGAKMNKEDVWEV